METKLGNSFSFGRTHERQQPMAEDSVQKTRTESMTHVRTHKQRVSRGAHYFSQ